MAVYDNDYLGYCFKCDRFNAAIFIDHRLSWKHKLYVLAHEIGHTARLKPDGGFRLLKKNCKEQKANNEAEKILEALDCDVDDYLKFYKSVKELKK